VADIYSLFSRRSDLEAIERMGKKSVDNLLNAIEASKRNPPERLLFALGIRLVGSRVAKLLINHFRSISAIQAADEAMLSDIPEIGGKIAASVREYMENPKTAILLANFDKAGLNMISEGGASDIENDGTAASVALPLKGLAFVVTGALPGVGRREIEKRIEELGGKVSNSVSKKTDYLLAGGDAGGKLAKAEDLGIKIIDYDTFNKMTTNE
jgi:DNA ligase (NAD+)